MRGRRAAAAGVSSARESGAVPSGRCLFRGTWSRGSRRLRQEERQLGRGWGRCGKVVERDGIFAGSTISPERASRCKYIQDLLSSGPRSTFGGRWFVVGRSCIFSLRFVPADYSACVDPSLLWCICRRVRLRRGSYLSSCRRASMLICLQRQTPESVVAAALQKSAPSWTPPPRSPAILPTLAKRVPHANINTHPHKTSSSP